MPAADDPVLRTDLTEISERDLPWEELRGARILVTGAGGMLPSYVARTLLHLNDQLSLGTSVVGLVRNETTARRRLADISDRPDFRFLEQDVSVPLTVGGAVDYVVHGASPARPALHGTDPVATFKANVLGTLNLLDLCVAKQSRGFVLMSSAEIYGNQAEANQLIGEEDYGGLDILNPRACYSEGKRAAETACAAYHAQHDLRCVIARFGHVYGPGLELDDGRVQADFAASVVAGEPIVLNSDGRSVRTYTYVADAVAGLFYALLLGTETAYNIADPNGFTSIRGLAEHFAGARPARGISVTFTDQAHATAGYSPARAQGLDSSRIAALGWRAEVDLRTGVDRMIASYEPAPRDSDSPSS